MKIPAALGVFGAGLAMTGCMEWQLSRITDVSASDVDLRPPDAEEGACYGREISPAVIETVTKQVLVSPAVYKDDGTLVTPAAYQTETLQKIVTERANTWFKVPCEGEKFPGFTASVQRALKARGFYFGRITGEDDLRTKRAVKRFQKEFGINSGTLSLAGARTLGLVAYEFEKQE